MSFTFLDFGLGLTEHVQALDRITSILQAYFYGVIWAPCIFLSIGKEIENLRDLIEQLISESAESKVPESVIFRSDNKLAAQKVVQLAFHGVDASLSDLEATLQSAKAHRDQTEKWWTIFAKKIQFKGGDRSFISALENFRYHNWTFMLVRRILKRNDMDILLRMAQQSDQYLDELFAELFSSTGVDSMDRALINRFSEQADIFGKTFATSFRVEVVLRTSIYWTFKAITNIRQTQISKVLSSEDYLSLLKAYWIFQKFQDHPRADMPQEFQAIMVVIANELGFAAKVILEAGLELPSIDSLISCGDFQIWLDGDDIEDPTPPTPTSLQTRGTLTPQRSSVNKEIDVSRIVMSNTAVHPAVYSTYEGYKDDLSQNGSHYSSSNRRCNSMNTHGQAYRKSTKLTPPASPPDPQRRASASQANLIRNSKHSPRGSFDGGIQLRANSLGGSISRSMTVDPLRWGAPLLEDPEPYSGEGIIRSATADHLKWGIPLMEDPEQHSGEGTPYRGSPVSNKSNRYSQSHLPPLGSNLDRTTSNEPSPQTISAPYSPDSIFPVSPELMGFRLKNKVEAPDYGVKPGEIEVMKQRLLASNTCDSNSKWDECVVRIFRVGTGDLRVLTQWDKRVDQRFITPKDAELILEYGYHMQENFPVIFARKAGPGGYSLQSGKQSKSTSLSSVELPPASLYYKFKTIIGMFEFQGSLLGETVLADVRTVRAVRYKRGLLDGETSTNSCRIQIWREKNSQLRSPGTSVGGSINGTFRARPKQSVLRPRSRRIVMFLGKILLTVFITDDITIEENIKSLIVRIKPISHGAFGGRSYVKACILGNRDLSGGIRIDRQGIMIEDEEKFDDLRWIDIDFQTPAEMNLFADEFREALQNRRKERKENEELRRKAANGIRAG